MWKQQGSSMEKKYATERSGCLKFDDIWLTPREFEKLSVDSEARNWKDSLLVSGRRISDLMKEGRLHHGGECKCSWCKLCGSISSYGIRAQRQHTNDQAASDVDRAIERVDSPYNFGDKLHNVHSRTRKKKGKSQSPIKQHKRVSSSAGQETEGGRLAGDSVTSCKAFMFYVRRMDGSMGCWMDCWMYSYMDGWMAGWVGG